MIERAKTAFCSSTAAVAGFCMMLVMVTIASPVIAESPQARGSVPLREAINRYYGIRSTAIPKIIGGEAATWSNHKWQAALLVSWVANPAEAQFCGGSLVRNDWVVTAAHCVDGGTVREDVHVLTGTADLASGGERTNVREIVVHKDYDPNTFDNDIALLWLKHDGAGVPIAPITPSKEPNVVVSGGNAVVTGWGVTETGLPSRELKQVTVPLVEHSKCNGPASYDGAITERMICAGIDQGGMDSCQGDSGGPNTKDGFLIGIVSWGEGCARPFKYGVYTRVAKFADWIEGCMKDPQRCLAGQR